MKQNIEKALESLQKTLEQHVNLELDMLQPRVENTREGLCSWWWLSRSNQGSSHPTTRQQWKTQKAERKQRERR